jgi:hypothetical protein
MKKKSVRYMLIHGYMMNESIDIDEELILSVLHACLTFLSWTSTETGWSTHASRRHIKYKLPTIVAAL